MRARLLAVLVLFPWSLLFFGLSLILRAVGTLSPAPAACRQLKPRSTNRSPEGEQERSAMILKHSLVVGFIALALSGCSSAPAVLGRFGPSDRAVEQGLSSPNLDEDVTQGIQSGGVDRAIGGR